MKKLASPRINTRNPDDIEQEFQDIKARLAEKISLLETHVGQRFASAQPWKFKAFDVPCGEEFEPIFVVFEHSDPNDKRFVLLDLCVPHLMKGQKFSLDKKSKVFQKDQAVPAVRIKRGIVFIRKENEPVVKPSTRIHCPILDFSLAQLGAEPRQKAKAAPAPRGSRGKGAAARAVVSEATPNPVTALPPETVPVLSPSVASPQAPFAETTPPAASPVTVPNPVLAPAPVSAPSLVSAPISTPVPVPTVPIQSAPAAAPTQHQSRPQPQNNQHNQQNHHQQPHQSNQSNQGQKPQKLSGDLLEELKVAIVQECLTTIQKRRNKYIRKGLWRWIEREITDPNVHFFLIILSCMYQGEVSEALSRKFKIIDHYCKSPDIVLDTIFSAESAVAPEIMKVSDRHRKALRKFLECFSQMPPFEYLRSIFLREYRTTHDSIKSRTTVFNTLKELLARCGFSGEKEVNYPLEILDELGIFNGVMLGDYTELRIDNAGKKLKHLVPQFEWTPDTIYKLREDLARILNLPAMEFNLNAFLPQAFIGGSVSERLKKAEAIRNRNKQPENPNNRRPNNQPQSQNQPQSPSPAQGHQQQPRPHGGHHQGSNQSAPLPAVRAPEGEQLTFATLASGQAAESAPPRKSHDHGAVADQPAALNDVQANRPVPTAADSPSRTDAPPPSRGHQNQNRPQTATPPSHGQPPRPGHQPGRQGQNQGHPQNQGQPQGQGQPQAPVQHQGQPAPRPQPQAQAQPQSQPQSPSQPQRPVLYNDVFHVDEARHRFFEYFGGHPQLDEEAVKMALEMDRQATLKAAEPPPPPQPEYDPAVEDGAPPSKNGPHQNSGQPMRRDGQAVSPMGGPTAPNRDRRPSGGGRNHQGKRRSKNSKNRERQHRQAMSLMSK